MPKKIKQHFFNFLRVTEIFVTVIAGISIYKIMLGLIADTNWIDAILNVVTALYILIAVWFIWRFYTGVYRDGDFWAE